MATGKELLAPALLILCGIGLLSLTRPADPRCFRCIYCGFTAPDSEEYTCANPQGVRQRGMCKSCMFRFGAGSLPVIAPEYCGAGSGNQVD